MPKILVVLALALAAALSLAPATAGARPAGAASACAGSGVVPAPGTSRVVRKAVLCLLNAERRRRGVRPLRASAPLARAARVHSADMARRGYFRHVSPGGHTVGDRVARTPYPRRARRSWAVGETIGWGVGTGAAATTVVRRWMASPEHRRTVLNGMYEEVGIGVVGRTPMRQVGATYTADFGVRN